MSTFSPLRLLPLAIILSALFVACDKGTQYFTSPQPVDGKNLYQFPKSFQGTWFQEDDTFRIYKDHYISVIGYVDEKVINGLWVDPLDTISKATYLRDTALIKTRSGKYRSYNSLTTIKYDSLRHPQDTILKNVIKGNRIYEVSNNNLSIGIKYTIVNDTIQMSDRFSIGLYLDRKCFLRQVGKNQYVLCVAKVEGDIMSLDPVWWQIHLLSLTANNELLVREIEQDKIEQHKIYEKNSTGYYDAQWTTAEWQNLIQKGVFADTVYVLKKISVK